MRIWRLARRPMAWSWVTTSRVMPSRVQVLQDRGHLAAGTGVEVAGGFVGEQDAGLHHDAAADGDALALAARQLVRQVMGAPVYAELFQNAADLAVALFRRDTGQHQRQLDVLPRGQPGDEVIGLEHEADLFAAQAGPFILPQRHGVHAVEQVACR